MTKYKIQNIPGNYFFHGVVFLDDGFILASPEIPVDERIKKLILKWEFQELSAEGEPGNEPPRDLLPFFENPEGYASASPDTDDDGRVIRATEIYTQLTEFTEKLLNKVSSNFNA